MALLNFTPGVDVYVTRPTKSRTTNIVAVELARAITVQNACRGKLTANIQTARPLDTLPTSARRNKLKESCNNDVHGSVSLGHILFHPLAC